MMKLALAQRIVEEHPYTEKQLEISDISCPGLQLIITRTKKRFIHRYSFNGKRCYRKIGTHPFVSLREARQDCTHFKSTLFKNLDAHQPNITIGQLTDQYIQENKAYGGIDKSQAYRIMKYIIPTFQHKLISTVTRRELIIFRSTLAGKIANSTVNRIMAAVSSLFRFAIELEYVSSNPMASIRALPENNIRHRWLNDEELKRFIAACKSCTSPVPGRVLLFALFTGFRISEATGLRWRYVSADLRVVTLPVTKNGRAFTVTLTDQATELLRQCQGLNSEFVFPSMVREEQSLSYPRDAFRKICKAAGIEDLKIHDLRKTYAMMVLQTTGDMQITATLLNHTSTAMTKRYAKYLPEQLAGITQQITRSFTEKAEGKYV
ncbi:tyrosine-type recombinase/integrase [Yersinia intermedia]|uniref:tyrosine-type recombinase/integrase n=1 Tax=Yersinia intermedia TaxID=631 RepID=UPI0039C67D15